MQITQVLCQKWSMINHSTGFIRPIERKPTFIHEISSCKVSDKNYAEVLGIKFKVSFLGSDLLITEML